MGTRAAIAVAMMTAFQTTSAMAGYMDGNKLLDQCGNRSSGNYMSCIGYLMGLSDAIDMTQDAGGARKQICIPVGVTTGQLLDIVVDHLKKNPADRHREAAFQVWAAYRSAFPCRQ